VQPDLAETGLGEYRLKVAMVEIVRVQDQTIRRREDQVIGDLLGAIEERMEKPFVSQLEKRLPQIA
jgi:hypothetical protein